MLNFPNSPLTGQQFTVGNTTWVFDGTKWVTSAAASNMPAPGTALPLMDGTAAVGTSYLYTRQDHVHPANTTLASTTTPNMDGTAAIGTGLTWARADHVHPTDTSRYAASNPSNYQTGAQVSSSLGAYLPLSGGTVTGALTVNSNVNFAGGVISASGGAATITNLTVGGGGLWAANGTTDLSTTNMHASTTYVSNANHIPTNNACASGYGGQAWNQVGSYSFFNASDPRDKKHIALSPEGALDDVNRVPVVRYRWNIDDDDAPIHTGFLATDVAGVLGPDRAAVMVGPDEARSMGLNLLDMIAMLWQAVQELSAEVGR